MEFVVRALGDAAFVEIAKIVWFFFQLKLTQQTSHTLKLIQVQSSPFDAVVAIAFAFLDYYPSEHYCLSPKTVDCQQFENDVLASAVNSIAMVRHCFACYCAVDSPNDVLD